MKAIKDCKPMNKEEAEATYIFVEEDILPLISAYIYSQIGSFGKKELINDLDIAVVHNSIYDAQKILIENGFEVIAIPGFNQLTIAVPFAGDKDKGTAQVDLMFTHSLVWCQWAYYSPNSFESKYKGVYRNAFMSSIISEMDKEVTKWDKDKIEEYEHTVIRFHSGIWKVKKTYKGKKGLVKTPKIIDEKLLTNDPFEAAIIMLGDGQDIETYTFEEIWKWFISDLFPYKGREIKMMTKLRRHLDNAKLEYPKEVLKSGYSTLFY